MEISLVKTFLEIVSRGSFIRAAEQLHVTQTAVTARIRSLEQELEGRLFIRNRSGARLTPEGERFLPHAIDILNAWTQAKRSVTLPDGAQTRLRLGSEVSLWNPLLINWMAWIREELEGKAVNSQVAEQSILMTALERGQLDAVIVHTPSYFSGFVVEQLLEEKLIRVQNPLHPQPDLYIDWGVDFERLYRAVVKPPNQCAISFDLGPAALQFMLEAGGNAWFRTRVVRPYLDSGKLQRVSGAPEFTYPVYLIYRADAENTMIEAALAGLRQLACSDIPWNL